MLNARHSFRRMDRPAYRFCQMISAMRVDNPPIAFKVIRAELSNDHPFWTASQSLKNHLIFDHENSSMNLKSNVLGFLTRSTITLLSHAYSSTVKNRDSAEFFSSSALAKAASDSDVRPSALRAAPFLYQASAYCGLILIV